MGEFLSSFSSPFMVLALALVLGFVISIVLGPIFIPMLHKFKFGQNIREEGPKSHFKKAGTPTMGGVIFIISVTIVMFVMRYKLSDEGMIILYSMIAFGFIGFLDDMLKIIHKNNLGLRAWQKMLLLLLFSIAMAYYSYNVLGTSIVIPFLGIDLNLGIVYIPFVILYYAGATNAVNLTDGLDGLASSVTVIVLIFFSIMSYRQGNYQITVFCVALIGALLGFLKYNKYPAKIFMGDTGSLALGGAVASIALLLKNPIILAIVGGIYVFETLSVIIQVVSFKTTGKRVFKMAPVHHHFEQLGWSEKKVVFVFSLVTIILCIIGGLSL